MSEEILTKILNELTGIRNDLTDFKYELTSEMKTISTKLDRLVPVTSNITATTETSAYLKLRTEKARLQSLLKKLFLETYDEHSRKRVVMKFGIGDSSRIGHTLDSISTSKEANGDVVQSFLNLIETVNTSATPDDLALYLKCDLKFLKKSITESSPLSAILDRLCTSSEETIQTELCEKWFSSSGDEYCCALDSHRNNYHAPFFFPPSSENSGGESVCRNTGKPDFASLALSMFVELKGRSSDGSTVSEGCGLTTNDYAILSQAIERVWMCAFQNELLKRVFAFATTGSRSWLVYCERNYSPGKSSSVSNTKVLEDIFYVIPIDTKYVLPVWSTVTRAALEDKNYYLHKNAYFVRDILSHLKLDLAYCRTTIIAVSDATVYGISPHRAHGQTGMEFSQKPVFAVKVHLHSLFGQAELDGLQHLRGCQHAAKYVLGTFQYSKTTNELMFEDFLAARSMSGVVTNSNSSSSSSTAEVATTTSTPALMNMFSGQQGTIFSLANVDKDLVCITLPSASNTSSCSATITAPWWAFNRAPTATAVTATATLPAAKRPKHDTDTATDTDTDTDTDTGTETSTAVAKVHDNQTAVLMYLGSKAIQWRPEFRNGLFIQLKEMHSKYLFHTDMRTPNVLSFDFSLRQSSGSSSSRRVTHETREAQTEFCIIDFDCSVYVESKDTSTGIAIDISVPGGRTEFVRQCATTSLINEANKTVQWTAMDETAMLVTTINQLSNHSNANVIKSKSIYHDIQQEKV